MQSRPDRAIHKRSNSPCRFEITIDVPIGSRVIVASDLMIGRTPENNRPELDKFSKYLRTVDGPGIIVLAGNFFDLLSSGYQNSVIELINLHPNFFDEIRHLIRERGFTLYVIPGSRDRDLAWNESIQREICDDFQATVAVKVILRIETTTTAKYVTIISGREYDPRCAPQDPFSPSDTPWLTHLIGEIIPSITTKAKWLDGMDLIDNPSAISRFIASRVFYHKAMKYLPWLIAPIIFAFFLKLPLIFALPIIGDFKYRIFRAAPFIQATAAATLVDAILVMAIATWIARRAYIGLIGSQVSGDEPSQPDPNIATRIAAADYIAQNGLGFITGHTLNPELSDLDDGFFCSTGGITTIYRESTARLGLPAVFQPSHQCTWVELQPGAKVRVRLYSLTEESQLPSKAERLVTVGLHDHTSGLRILASYPGGEEYQRVDDRASKFSRPRRVSALAVFLVGFVNLISALTPPLRSHLHLITEFLPVVIPETANALSAMEAVGLLALSSGLKRGQRVAYILTLAITVASVITNMLKGGDAEESLVLMILIGFLLASRRSFNAPSNRIPFAKSLFRVPLGWLLILIAGTITLQADLLIFTRHTDIGLWTSFLAVLERMVGSRAIYLPRSINIFLSPALLYTSLFLFAILLFRAFRPVVEARVARLHLPGRPVLTPIEIVERYSTSTLDYFALRDDKSYYTTYNTLIAYAVIGTVVLVSPDPIGPDATAKQAWNEFRHYSNSNGWTICILGAGDKWLPTYASDGFHSMYVGDEAVVSTRNFSLDGKKNKSLRQAVNRMRNHGYTIQYLDPLDLTDGVRDQLLEILTKSRRGNIERGFSMTLGRFLDPKDKGLLLTICFGPAGNVVGFCQWVPAPGINGFSLDLMRRDLGEHPNGMTDLMVVSTIEYLRERHLENLSLNFATMRAIIAGETEEGLQVKLERWFLKRLSDTAQIESLWRFNSKFNPKWLPRYLVFDSPQNLPQIAIAIARAESFWEIPVIGKFLVPKTN